MQKRPKKQRRNEGADDTVATGKPAVVHIPSVASSVKQQPVPSPPPHRPGAPAELLNTKPQPPAVSRPSAGTHAGSSAHDTLVQQQRRQQKQQWPQQQMMADSMVAGGRGGERSTPAAGQPRTYLTAAAAAAAAAFTGIKTETELGASIPSKEGGTSLEQQVEGQSAGAGTASPSPSQQPAAAGGHAESTHRGAKRRKTSLTPSSAPACPAPQLPVPHHTAGEGVSLQRLLGTGAVPGILHPTSSASALESKQEVRSQLSVGYSMPAIWYIASTQGTTRTMCAIPIGIDSE